MNPTYDFTGQVALVTGASSGMGLTTARAFAEAGAAVVLADINQAALQTATDALAAAGHQALGAPCDVADEANVVATVKAAVDTFGRLDIPVRCGARRASKPIVTTGGPPPCQISRPTRDIDPAAR